jgi:hypothetical protein
MQLDMLIVGLGISEHLMCSSVWSLTALSVSLDTNWRLLIGLKFDSDAG